MERLRAGVVLLSLFLLLFLAPASVRAADDPQEPAPFTPEEIEALVAPIALYPDPLLAQVLMASTYPLEIVHAARWLKENPKIKGDAAVKAVENQTWDVSVKSLVAFPQILAPMNDTLDWTQRLGDAFLAQQQDVFAAVQRLRMQAQKAGNLESNAQQKVVVDPAPKEGETTVVRIEPANPEVIYVPAYNPTVVYGGWSQPAYPPTYWPPAPAYYPGTALMSGLAWGVGVAAAGALFSDCNWGGGDVDINYNKVTNINRNVNVNQFQGQNGRWQHDPGHRQGVAYRDNATRQKMTSQVPGADKRAQYRGRSADPSASAQLGATANRPSLGDQTTAANRANLSDRTAGGNRGAAANRPPATDRAGAGNRPPGAARPADGQRVTSSNRPSTPGQAGVSNRATGTGANRTGTGGARHDSAFSGVGTGGAAAQRSYDRGRTSMQGSTASRHSGATGGARAGGGAGGMRGGGGGGMHGGGGRR